MEPLPCSNIDVATRRESRQTVLRFSANTRSHSSSIHSAIGLVVAPTGAVDQDINPAKTLDCKSNKALALFGIRDIGRDGNRLPPESANILCGRFEWLRPSTGQCDVGIIFGQDQR